MDIVLRAMHFRNSEYSDPLLCPIARALLENPDVFPIIVSDTNVTFGIEDFSMAGVYSYRLYKNDLAIAEAAGFDTSTIRIIQIFKYKTKRKRRTM